MEYITLKYEVQNFWQYKDWTSYWLPYWFIFCCLELNKRPVRNLVWTWVDWVIALIGGRPSFRLRIILLGTLLRFVPGFALLCSGMFPERFRTVSVPVTSRETRLILTEHPESGILSCCIPGTGFQWPCIQSPRKLELCLPHWFQERTPCVTDRS